jgi:hypothetical protein
LDLDASGAAVVTYLIAAKRIPAGHTPAAVLVLIRVFSRFRSSETEKIRAMLTAMAAVDRRETPGRPAGECDTCGY